MDAEIEIDESVGAPAVERLEGKVSPEQIAAAFDRYAALLHDFLRETVEDESKAARITQAGFIAACQALAVGGGKPSLEPPRAEHAVVGGGGPCPKLGYADDRGGRYSRPTRLHRCYASGSGVPVSTHEQGELCLTNRFGTCPRFVGAAGDQTAGTSAGSGSPGGAAEPVADLATRMGLGSHRESSVTDDRWLTRDEDEPARSPSLAAALGHRARFAGRRYWLLIAVVVAVATAVGIALALRAWDDAGGPLFVHLNSAFLHIRSFASSG